MHPRLFQQLVLEHRADLERRLVSARRCGEARAGTRRGPGARARLRRGVGWLLVDLGLRLAVRRGEPEPAPGYARLQA